MADTPYVINLWCRSNSQTLTFSPFSFNHVMLIVDHGAW